MRRRAGTVVVASLVAVAVAGCGGTARTGRTVTFKSAGTFPPSTIVGTYSADRCKRDARTLVRDALLYYRHSTGAPGPADLYYYDMRFAYAHVQADGCTNEELATAMERGLTARQRTWLLHNVASNLDRAFRAALG